MSTKQYFVIFKKGNCRLDGATHKCDCKDGWKGDSCNLKTCVGKNCPENSLGLLTIGKCEDKDTGAVCNCNKGYKEVGCNQMDCTVFNGCTGHGKYYLT